MVVSAVTTDYKRASRQLVRALRGQRSQVSFSRFLRYKSNIAAAWEGGYRSPAMPAFFFACERMGVNLTEVSEAFHEPVADLFDGQDCSVWMSALCASTSTKVLAQRTQFSEPQIRRWRSGRAQMRLPQFLALLDASTGRAAEWVALVVEIDQVPALLVRVQAVQAARTVASAYPWSAPLRVLISSQPFPVQGATRELSELFSVPEPVITETLKAMLKSGLIEKSGGFFRSGLAITVDMQASVQQRVALRAHWASVAAKRTARGEPTDLSSYSWFAVSREDLKKIQQVYREAFRASRSIIAASKEPEVAALLVTQIHGYGAASPKKEDQPAPE